MKKKLFSFLLAAVMVLSLLPGAMIAPARALTDAEVVSALEQLKAQYPQGSYWPASESYGGWQCYSFARGMANGVFGSYPGNMRWVDSGSTDGNGWTCYKGQDIFNITVQPGDLIQTYTNDSVQHSAIVYQVNGSTIYVGECWGSQNNIIKWGSYFNGNSVYATLSGIAAKYSITAVWKHPGSKSSGVVAATTPEYTVVTGTYYLKNKATGKYLDAYGAGDANNVNVQVYDFNGSNAQQWSIAKSTTTGSNTVSIHPQCSGRMMNVYTSETVSAGRNVCLWDDTGHNSQRWGLEKVSGGYIIRSAQNSACVLDTDGSNVLVSAYNGGNSQIWILEATTQSTGAQFTLSGHNYPTSINVGNYYDLVGTVSCNLTITSLNVGVYDAASGGTQHTGRTVSPNSTTYNIKDVDRDVLFNKLSAGTYYYRITATASDGTTKQLLNQKFTVNSTSGGNQQVMTAAQFVDCLQKALARKTKYNNTYPYNLGYYDGSAISWDCWNLGKSILWSRGAIVDNYTVGNHARSDTSFGLGDWTGLTIIQKAPNCNGDFTNLVPGEWLYLDGHTGYYVGNGQVIECTTGWGAGGVIRTQIDSSGNRSYNGSSGGKWLYHGMVPWIDYSGSDETSSTIPVTSVTMNWIARLMTEGETISLTATISPADATDKTVTWSSSNTSVATVSGGYVYAVGTGTATITATAGGKSDTCTVTVGTAVIPVTGVTLDKRSVSLNVGESTTLTYTVQPTNAADQTVRVSSADRSVAAVSVVNNALRVEAKSAGIVTVTVTTTEGGYSATCDVTVVQDTPTDVDKSAWYYNAVKYVMDKEIMSGYGSGLFGPNDNLSRAMVVQVLYNAAGKPTVTASNPFSDVPSGQWFTDAVRWAANKNIVSGFGGGLFKPNDSLTVEQLAVILYNYSGSPAVSGSPYGVGKYSDWAGSALCWTKNQGILTGVPFTDANESGTRAQTAQMLMNFLK